MDKYSKKKFAAELAEFERFQNLGSMLHVIEDNVDENDEILDYENELAALNSFKNVSIFKWNHIFKLYRMQ